MSRVSFRVNPRELNHLCVAWLPANWTKPATYSSAGGFAALPQGFAQALRLALAAGFLTGAALDFAAAGRGAGLISGLKGGSLLAAGCFAAPALTGAFLAGLAAAFLPTLPEGRPPRPSIRSAASPSGI